MKNENAISVHFLFALRVSSDSVNPYILEDSVMKSENAIVVHFLFALRVSSDSVNPYILEDSVMKNENAISVHFLFALRVLLGFCKSLYFGRQRDEK